MTKSLDRRAQSLMLALAMSAHREKGGSDWVVAGDVAVLEKGTRGMELYNETECNRETTAAEKERNRLRRELVMAMAKKYGACVHFGGDPRGPAVRLYWPEMIPAGCDPDSFTDRMIAVGC